MAGRRLLYLAVLGFCLVFYIAYGQWLSWLILLTVLLLPWFSLILSLPALIRFRGVPGAPDLLELGADEPLWLMGSCPFPMPPFRGRLRLERCFTGESWYYEDSTDLPTNHCGGLRLTAEGVKVYDYLGLFAFRRPCREKKIILIRPRPLPMVFSGDLQPRVVRAWRPKFGGGFGENHELRLYRPGDSLNQVHWKLSAKTGDLILRQPMEPQPGLILVTLHLRGDPETMDRKLGRLLWLGRTLLAQEVVFELRALTGDGLLTFSIADEKGLNAALDTLLCSRAAQDGRIPQDHAALWHCHIGGTADEA